MYGSGLEAHPKQLIVNKPFWVVMKQKDSTKPYFITQVNNANFMKIQ